MSEAKLKTRPATLSMEVKCDGTPIFVQTMALRTFASGKIGYGGYGKTMLPNGEQVQITANYVIPHSDATGPVTK